MQVEIWSDVVCPWCYIGKRRFEAALARFEHADEVEVTWRSFELQPDGPALPEGTMVDRMAARFGTTPDAAAAKLAEVDRTAAGAGLTFRLADTRGGNTFAAHRLLHLARRSGHAGALKEAFLQANFVDTEAIGDHDVLRRICLSVGLDPAEVDEVLAGDRYADDVRSEEAEAGRLGANGVPFFVFDRALAVPGAQDPDVFVQVLEEAWARTHPEVTVAK